MKICSICLESKEVSDFYKRADGIGVRSVCIVCWKQTSKENRKSNREACLDRARRWRQRRPLESQIYSRIRARSRKENLEFDLTLYDINIPNFCPILGLQLHKGNGRPTWHSPSVDRIDPNKGYLKGNIQIISQRANLLKSNMTYEEISALYEWFTQQELLNLNEKGKMK